MKHWRLCIPADFYCTVVAATEKAAWAAFDEKFAAVLNEEEYLEFPQYNAEAVVHLRTTHVDTMTVEDEYSNCPGCEACRE